MKKLTRWLPAAAVPVVVAAGVIVLPAMSAAGDVPNRTPQQVLGLVSSSAAVAFSGTVEQSSNLGLPDLPASDMKGYGSKGEAAIVDLLTGDHQAKVFSNGSDGERVQVLDRLAERDLIRSGNDVWAYDSKRDEAVHTVLPPHSAYTPPASPPDLAAALLSKLDPSTEVSVTQGSRVAGHDVYVLVLTPRTKETLVANIRLSVEVKTGLPLRVEVDSTNGTKDAAAVGFRDIDFGSPSPDLFRFTPARGTVVHEHQVRPGEMPALPQGRQPVVTGKGWASVVELRADVLSAADPKQSSLLDRLTVAVPEGRVLSTSLVSVLFTSDGRVLAGAVPVATLQAAAR
jgi:outer membrane lipoprotein-sorting protein